MNSLRGLSVDVGFGLAGDALRNVLGKVKPRRIVTLHHLACSGGTIMTKSLAAMNNTLVLSEIHPDRAAQPAFHPLAQLRRGYENELTRTHIGTIQGHFRREIAIAHGIAVSLGKTLIVRDHSHVDFVWRKNPQSMLIDELSGTFKITPIVTVRDPREVWLSLSREGWFDGTPDELCAAHLRLLDAFPDAAVFRYEDFTRDPKSIVRQMCASAGIAFDENFQEHLDEVQHLTGDSGRKGVVIAPRPAKELPADDQILFDNSVAYKKLVTRLKQGVDVSTNRKGVSD